MERRLALLKCSLVGLDLADIGICHMIPGDEAIPLIHEKRKRAS